MLTLTRRCGERIAIGSNIEVTVLDVSGGRVKLGIRAPRELPVYRGELIERIENENRRALARSIETDVQAPEITIIFPDGLFGMRSHQEFVIYDIADGNSCRLLVSKDDPTVQLTIIDACEVFPNYPAEDARLTAGLEEEVAVAAVVTAPADGSAASVNLLAPIVIGMRSHRGRQIILDQQGFGVRHVLDVKSKVELAGKETHA